MTTSAREMSKRSMAAVLAKDRAGWLALFADDAVVEDPIGVSMFDPSGLGHRGKEAIAAFYDTVIAPNDEVRFTISASYESANEVANVGKVETTLAGGTQKAVVNGVFTYIVGDDGLVRRLRAYWQIDDVEIVDA